MLIVTKSYCDGTFLFRDTCVCGCQVLVPEKEVLEETWEGSDGYTNFDRYCRCPTPLCNGRIELKPDGYITEQQYADLVAKYGPEV